MLRKLILLCFFVNGVFSLKVVENEVCTGEAKDCLKKTSKERYEDLRRNLADIRISCGDLCDTNLTGTPGKYFDVIKKDFSCEALFRNELIDKPSEFPSPPQKIPKYLKTDFTYNGRITFKVRFDKVVCCFTFNKLILLLGRIL